MKIILFIIQFVLFTFLFSCSSGGGVGDNVLNLGFSDLVGLVFLGDPESPSEAERPKPDFHQAVVRGNLQLVKWYVDQGTDINKPLGKVRHSQIERDITALGESVKENHYEISEYLLKNGANPNIPNTVNPLFYAIQGKEYKMVSLLLSYHANPDESGFDDTTLLMRTIEMGEIELTRELLKNGADPTYVTKDGRSALRLAQDKKDVRSQWLIEQATPYRDE